MNAKQVYRVLKKYCNKEGVKLDVSTSKNKESYGEHQTNQVTKQETIYLYLQEIYKYTRLKQVDYKSFRNYTLAHELGHHYYRHGSGHYNHLFIQKEWDERPGEQQAHYYGNKLILRLRNLNE